MSNVGVRLVLYTHAIYALMNTVGFIKKISSATGNKWGGGYSVLVNYQLLFSNFVPLDSQLFL